MSFIFGGGQQEKTPTRLNRVQINQSVQGYPLPVVMGRGKVQQSLIWVDGFTYTAIKQGGKGIGGGGKGGTTTYVYNADVIAALCNGRVTGIGDVWSGQTWLSATPAAESYTIDGGSPVYTPLNVDSMAGDSGVSLSTAYSSTQTDLGADAPATLSGTDDAPFTRVDYGTALSSGQYSIDDSGNYHFSAADAGKTVTINYCFCLFMLKQQEQVLVPLGGGLVPISGVFPDTSFQTFWDGGVVYCGGPNDGKKFRLVTGTPTLAGTYAVTQAGSDVEYHFAAADGGSDVTITYQLLNTTSLSQYTPALLNFTLFDGSKGQAIWALLLSNFPGAALGYTGIAFVAYAPMSLGFGAQIQSNVFEVQTADAYGGGILDCSPIQCILQVLTNPQWGLGSGKRPFPSAIIDNGTGGTWGRPAPGGRVSDGSAFAWFAANGFFISPVIDKQETAASLISRWLEAGQCAAFMSEGLFKLVPYGDTSTAGNGATWQAPTAFACALDDTCFLKKAEGEDPVKISSSPWQDAYNRVQIQWNNRANQYAPEITPEEDQSAIDRYGLRIEDPVSWDFITTLPAATFAGSMRVKRGVYTRNTYEFSLPHSYSYLEPMDVVYITTSSAWAAGRNNLNLALASLPVRITKIVDHPGKEGLQITAEDYPFGVHQPTIYNKDISAGTVQPNAFAHPGDTVAVVFEPTNRLTGYQGNQVWIGAIGKSKDWGGCKILASTDGDKYTEIGIIKAQARVGVLDASFPSGSDPDTVHSLVIDLETNSPALDSGTTDDADNMTTLCYVGGEIVSYSACAISGQNQYTASGYIRRGLMDSSIASHAAGAAFLRLDDAVFRYTYDPPAWSGKTLYLKFQSFNTFGNSLQDPSTLTPVTFTLPGTSAQGPVPKPATIGHVPVMAGPVASVGTDTAYYSPADHVHPSDTSRAPAPLTGTSGSLGGSAMTAGQTVTATVTVTGARAGMLAACNPGTYPGAGFVWDAYVSADNTVTVRLVCVAAGTPTAATYGVRVIQ